MSRRKQKNETFGYTEPVPEKSHASAPVFFAPQVPHAPTEIPEALLGVPASEPRSLADELVTRAEETRAGVVAGAGYVQAALYIGDAILALTERLTELD